MEDVNRPEIPWKKAGFEARQGGNTSPDSFTSNLLLLLINIFTGSVSWEEHCPWVRSEFILVNNSWTLLIHFSTGSKAVTFVLLWLGKEKPHKITKQAEEKTLVWAFQGGIRKKKWQGGVIVTKISVLCPCTHLSEEEGMLK